MMAIPTAFFNVQDVNAYRGGRVSPFEFSISEATRKIFKNLFSENLDFG
jgi:hypothetical protein